MRRYARSRGRVPLSHRARELLRVVVKIARAEQRRPTPAEVVRTASDWRVLVVLIDRGYLALTADKSALRPTKRGYETARLA